MSTTITIQNDMSTATGKETTTSYFHPNYAEAKERWDKMRDVLGGETVVKDAGETYLPKTDGQKKLPTGSANYDAYKSRAIFWDYPREISISIEGLLGRKAPELKLPTSMESMLNRCTPTGQSMATFISYVQAGQVEYGRIGILADVPNVGNPNELFLYSYAAAQVLNWNTQLIQDEDRLTMVLLDESKYVLTGLEWNWVSSYRVCALDSAGIYYTGTFTEKDLADFDLANPPETVIRPAFRSKVLNRIPFAFANLTSIEPDIERPPLENIADLSLALYRVEADYRQALFLQGQATPAFFGFTKEQINDCMLGAGGGIFSTNKDARAEFLEPSGASIGELRQANADLHAAIVARGVSLLESNEAESGEALKTRVANKTASLNSISATTDAAMSQILRICADWMGADKNVVAVITCKDFHDMPLTGQDLLQYVTAWTQGAPVTHEDLYGIAKRAGIARKTYEETIAQNMADRGTAFGVPAGSGSFHFIGEDEGGGGSPSSSPSGEQGEK
jgi:hypothetical protein